eukprot:CAMPEP_0179334234 /NCGR_PEP_ID=MMETSP0797-20121207/65824_1 /TAXON_ID=47934 /ORGANISM="Dinophysis acuminata, Strain DAEP01" /LENGTH=49 /DNA_ID= /DNA_START= /DNA_END= /DNA_ORIENTATION=
MPSCICTAGMRRDVSSAGRAGEACACNPQSNYLQASGASTSPASRGPQR